MPSDDVLDRVRKLLALAGSDNVHEAAAAAARAQALITQHRLDDWLTDDASHVDPITDARDEPLEVFRKLRRWKTVLAAELARANGCVAYTLQRANDQALVLIGRKRDRDAVKALYDDLVVRLEWLSATHGPGKGKKWHDSFRIGAVHTLSQRLQQAPALPVETSRTALARIEPRMAAHERELERVTQERLGTGRSRSIRVIGEAWDRGMAAATDLDVRE